MTDSHEISDPALRLRLEWARALCFALGECDPSDAAAICCAYLETVETGGPLYDPFEFTYGGAALWAEAAPVHEVTAFTLAGLRALPDALLSRPARKRCFAALWAKFPHDDRRAFLARVDGEGAFHGKGAAQ